MASKPLLDLATLIERPTIAIDGKSYELRGAEELSIYESQWLTSAGNRIERIAKEGGGEDELGEAIDAVVKKVVVDLPAEVFDRLSGIQRMAIVEVFTALLARRKTRVAGAVARAIITAAGLSTGEGTSPGSSASSEAAPSTGSTTCPPRS